MENILSNYSSPFLAAIALGLSCGTGCSPVISIFLTTYIMGKSNSVLKGLLSFLYFFLGKTSVTIILALFSAFFGSAILGKSGKIFGFKLNLILDIFLILTGLYFVLGMLLQSKKDKKNKCKECNSCGNNEKIKTDKGGFAVFLIGAAYAITPCSPFLMVLVLASLNSPISAIPISVLFNVANSISPLILVAAMAGFFSKKMHEEIPQLINLFQLFSFIIFIIAGGVSLYFHLT